MSFPPTPTRPRPSQSGPSRATQPSREYYADALLSRGIPNYTPMSDADLRKLMRSTGFAEDQIQRYIDTFNARAEEIQRAGGVRVVGVKPSMDAPNVHTVNINDALLIRMWDGGMEEFDQFCLDFIDRQTLAPVNLPPGYSIYPASANTPGVFMSGGPLPSIEQSYG